jgi:chromosome segregation ATPase
VDGGEKCSTNGLANLGTGEVSEGDGAFRLLGGDEGEAPQPRQGALPSSPPMPRQKPVNKAEEDARRADCERYKHHYVLQRRAINEAEGRKAKAERRVQELRRQRQYWLNEIAEIETDLRSARSRSTDPSVQDIVECPSDRDPRKPPRGRRERRAEQEKMIQEGLCTTVSRIDVELAKDRWRERLERAKAQDISELEAEGRSAKRKIQDIDAQITQAQGEVERAAADVRFYQGGLASIFRDYEASCGDHRELFSIVP